MRKIPPSTIIKLANLHEAIKIVLGKKLNLARLSLTNLTNFHFLYHDCHGCSSHDRRITKVIDGRQLVLGILIGNHGKVHLHIKGEQDGPQVEQVRADVVPPCS